MLLLNSVWASCQIYLIEIQGDVCCTRWRYLLWVVSDVVARNCSRLEVAWNIARCWCSRVFNSCLRQVEVGVWIWLRLNVKWVCLLSNWATNRANAFVPNAVFASGALFVSPRRRVWASFALAVLHQRRFLTVKRIELSLQFLLFLSEAVLFLIYMCIRHVNQALYGFINPLGSIFLTARLVWNTTGWYVGLVDPRDILRGVRPTL